MLHFVKMQGLGNDYLYVCSEVPHNAAELSRRFSDRHFGVGADGMIYITPPTDPRADFGMRIFNADGSEAQMCGNGIRCVGKYVYDRRLTDKTSLTIETQAGLRYLTLHPSSDNPAVIDTVTVDMGHAVVADKCTLTVGDTSVTVFPVSTGNPHTVHFAPDTAQILSDDILTAISTHPQFPGGINAECAVILSPTELRMRVCERGSGITLACGTGACAVCAAAAKQGYVPHDTPITVHLDGGDLTVTVHKDGRVMMRGHAVTVFEGTAEI